MRLFLFLARRYVHNPLSPINLWMRLLLKWWLEFVRNLLVVGGFFYIAYRSDQAILIVLAWVNVGALAWYVYLHLFNRSYFKFFALKNTDRTEALNSLLTGLVTGIPIAIIGIMLFSVFEALQYVAPK